MSDFGPQAYRDLITSLLDEGFTFETDPNLSHDKTIFLRHDVDLSLSDALTIAEFDHELGVTSNFYFLCRSDFYSITSRASKKLMTEITSLGHKVGLHFDPTVYHTIINVQEALSREIALLEWITELPCETVSQHQPSLFGLIDWTDLTDVIDVYGPVRDKRVDYLSDSNMKWRHLPSNRIKNTSRLQLLLHPEYWVDGSKGLDSVMGRISRSAQDEIKNALERELVIMEGYLAEREKSDSRVISNPVHVD